MSKVLDDLLEAAKAAYNHLDTYGIIEGDEREKERQQRVFDLLCPAIKAAEKQMKRSAKTGNLAKGDIFKRKFRYTLKGLDSNGETVWPECFVKIIENPAFTHTKVEERVGRYFDVPGRFTICQFFTMYDIKGEARVRFNRFDGQQDKVVTGYLAVYDGCGSVIETWTFSGVTMQLLPGDHSDDDWIEANWLVEYQGASYSVA